MIKDGQGSAEELVSYMDYLTEHYPTKDSEQNKAIHDDRIHSFARQGGPGAKFKNTQEKMLKALSLPKGAKEELNYPPEVADKILKGEPLFEEKPEGADDEGSDAEQDEDNKKSSGPTEEQKMMMQMFGEGKFHLIPSFFRTLIFLKK